ncbi:unnamed protein product [Moneuplotes crassus]|uniref:Uncharacterized protein n=1 Tax=Euplotes crassus TaxID=5936 RepID=A0AAD1Y252_EUPCR|nr:unnamed protein product [Moneuplotes crassus]
MEGRRGDMGFWTVFEGLEADFGVESWREGEREKCFFKVVGSRMEGLECDRRMGSVGKIFLCLVSNKSIFKADSS